MNNELREDEVLWMAEGGVHRLRSLKDGEWIETDYLVDVEQ